MLEQPQTDTYHEHRLRDPDQLTDATADYLRMHRLKRSFRRDATPQGHR